MIAHRNFPDFLYLIVRHELWEQAAINATLRQLAKAAAGMKLKAVTYPAPEGASQPGTAITVYYAPSVSGFDGYHFLRSARSMLTPKKAFAGGLVKNIRDNQTIYDRAIEKAVPLLQRSQRLSDHEPELKRALMPLQRRSSAFFADA